MGSRAGLVLLALGLLGGCLASQEVEVGQGRRLYTGFQVFRALPSTGGQRSALLRLGHSVDFWNEMGPRVRQVDLMVEPGQVERVAAYLAGQGIAFQVMIRDVQADIDQENVPDYNSTVALPYTKRDKRQNQRQRHRQRGKAPSSRRPSLSAALSSLWQHSTRPGARPARPVRPRRRPTALDATALSAPSPSAPSSSFSPSPPAKPSPSPCAWTGMSWTRYHSYSTMLKWMECMAGHYRDRVRIIHIGTSSEGRPLQVLRISSGSSSKPAVFIDGGIHAREWVSPAAVTFLVHRMLETAEFSKELDTYNIYVLPMANPDGYEYSKNHDRMWRKTRSRTGKKNLLGQECHGVDPNRNFGFEWGGYGASEDGCKETFRGSGPFSEPETRAMRDFLLSEAADFKIYLTFHSYGQYILYPWGYDTLDTRDWPDLHRVGMVAKRDLKKVNGVNYQLGSAAKMLYPASGGSDDWAKGGAGIKYSYTVELPDTGRHGFILPARFIRQVGFQAVTTVRAMLRAVGATLPK